MFKDFVEFSSTFQVKGFCLKLLNSLKGNRLLTTANHTEYNESAAFKTLRFKNYNIKLKRPFFFITVCPIQSLSSIHAKGLLNADVVTVAYYEDI